MEIVVFWGKVLLYTLIVLSFLYVIYKATLSLLKKTGLSPKLKVREGKFSLKDMRIKGYEYHESTYTMTEYAEALIRKDDIQLIQSLISIYNRKESYGFKILRYIIDHTKQNLGIYDSILYQAYCNGFKTGFWRLDEIIYKYRSSSTEILDIKIQQYLNKHKVKEIPDPSRNRAYSILQLCRKLGKQQGARVRKIQFEIDNDQEKRTLMDIFLNLDQPQKEELNGKIGSYLSKRGKGRKIGLVYCALQELQLIENGKNCLNNMDEATFVRVLNKTFTLSFVENSIYTYSSREKLDKKNERELDILKEEFRIKNRIE